MGEQGNGRMKTELIYGTGNPAKLTGMKRALEKLPVEVIGLKEAAKKYQKEIPYVEETGSTPLENARLKANAYYKVFGKPVFSCDSGLYLWDYETGELLPNEVQPGICVRGRGEKPYTDEELINKYTALAQKFGCVLGRYKNAICFVADEEHKYECEDESLWGEAFLLAKKPHVKRVPGFPIDSISIEIKSGQYYYDLEGDSQDVVAAGEGFKNFLDRYIYKT